MSVCGMFISVLLMSLFVVSLADTELIAQNQPVTFATMRQNFEASTGMNLTTIYTTSTGQQQITIYNVDFSIEPAREQLCAFFHLGLTADKGQYIIGNLTSTSRIDFYLLHDSDYQTLLKDFHCQISNPIVAGENILTYSFTFVAPDKADYERLFFNDDKETIPKVSFTLMTTGFATTTVVLPVHSTQTSVQITTAGQGRPWSYNLPLLVALLAWTGLGCVIAYRKLAKSRSPPTQIEPDSRYEKYLAKLESLRDSGTISEATYSRLKAEYENRRSAAAEDA